MSVIVTMDRAGRVVLPLALRKRLGLAGIAHRLEVVESRDGIVLRPVGTDVPVTRDASGWIVFHSGGDDVPSADPLALVDEERARRVREIFGE